MFNGSLTELSEKLIKIVDKALYSDKREFINNQTKIYLHNVNNADYQHTVLLPLFLLSSILISETQKRRRFHPLRNLRKIFRRRSVAQADTISPTSSLDDPTVGRVSSTRANETSPDGNIKSHRQHHSHQITSSVSVGGGFYAKKEKRERSADSARAKEVADELDKDMTDYQRSLSEGRLLDR